MTKHKLKYHIRQSKAIQNISLDFETERHINIGYSWLSLGPSVTDSDYVGRLLFSLIWLFILSLIWLFMHSLLNLTLNSHSKCSFSTLAWAFMAMDCRQSEKKNKSLSQQRIPLDLINLKCHCNMPIMCFSTTKCRIKEGWNSFGIIMQLTHTYFTSNPIYYGCHILYTNDQTRTDLCQKNIIKISNTGKRLLACFNWSTDESWFHWLVFILKSMICNFTWQVDLFHCIWIITLFFFLIWIIILEKKNNFQAFLTRILSYRQKNPNESCE